MNTGPESPYQGSSPVLDYAAPHARRDLAEFGVHHVTMLSMAGMICSFPMLIVLPTSDAVLIAWVGFTLITLITATVGLVVSRRHPKRRDLAICGLLVGGLSTLVLLTIPSYKDAGDDARAAGAQAGCMMLQGQVKFYAEQHNNHIPTFNELQDWSILTSRTDVNGRVTKSGEIGPYLPQTQIPMNPFTMSPQLVPMGSPTAGAGYGYDELTGKLLPILPKKQADKIKANPAEWLIVP